MKPMNHEKIPWEIISAQLKGNASFQQKELLRNWLSESEENVKTYQQILCDWQISNQKINFYAPDTERLWGKLLARIEKQPQKRLIPLRVYRWVAAAAVLVLVFLSGMWMGNFSSFFANDQVYTTVISPKGSRTQVVLPDSTCVWLNSGAEIRYPTSFERKTRDVYIVGECFFDVTKYQQKQFVVHAEKVDVRVFGTQFNVRENESSKQVDVALLEGKVSVFSKQNQPLTELKPGEQFTLANGKATVQQVSNIERLVAWKDNMLIFENEPFESVIQTLESWYGVEFSVDSQMLTKHNYTFKVKTESLSDVLDLISVITPIEYKIDGDKVMINYKNR